MLLDWQSLVFPVDGGQPSQPAGQAFVGGWLAPEDRRAFAERKLRRDLEEEREREEQEAAAMAQAQEAIRRAVRRNYAEMSKIDRAAREAALLREIESYRAIFRSEYARVLTDEFARIEEEETISVVAAALFAIH